MHTGGVEKERHHSATSKAPTAPSLEEVVHITPVKYAN
jgi:hypothetical protein